MDEHIEEQMSATVSDLTKSTETRVREFVRLLKQHSIAKDLTFDQVMAIVHETFSMEIGDE